MSGDGLKSELDVAATLPLRPATVSDGHAFAPDEVVAGRYRIARLIAEGGIGEVYEAKDLSLGERVALKTLRPEHANDMEVLERFRREITLSRKVTHRNVCRVYELGRHVRPGGDVLFLTMELLPGETLYAFLARQHRMAERDALPIVRQMAEALDAAHAAGVIHRDLKSGNVILVAGESAAGGLAGQGSDDQTAAVRAVVTDFGLARAIEPDPQVTLTRTGQVVGTPVYMAPEQARGLPVTPAVDIYSLGVVIYEMVTGHWPFGGGSNMTVALRRLKEPPIPPRSLAPELDLRWEAAILRCLEREPAKRFVKASDLVEALTAPLPVPDPDPKVPRRRRMSDRFIAAARRFGLRRPR